MLFKKILNALIVVPLIVGYSAYCAFANDSKAPKLAVFTDYEADDSVAVGLLMKYSKEHDVLEDQFLIGALLSNQYRKKALVQEMVKLFGYSAGNVYAGTGGIKEPFEEEGRNILTNADCQRFHELDANYLACQEPAAHQSQELAQAFERMLENASDNSIDVLLLTNPIDFVTSLEKNKANFAKINKIFMMGGWYDNKPTFNWQLHLESVKTLLGLLKEVQGKPNSPQLFIFSSHFFAREFNGYVNAKKFPEVIKAFDISTHPVASHLRNMVRNWDDSMTVIKDGYSDDEKAWRLEMVDRIGKENIGRQFAPADPATALGYLYPEQFILQQTPSMIAFIESTDAHGKMNTRVEVSPDPTSNVYVVDKVDLKLFSDKLVDLMSMSDLRKTREC